MSSPQTEIDGPQMIKVKCPCLTNAGICDSDANAMDVDETMVIWCEWGHVTVSYPWHGFIETKKIFDFDSIAALKAEN